MPPFAAKKFECSGSMDPRVVRYSFDKLSPIWQNIDFDECKRLEDARNNISTAPAGTVELLARRIQAAWPLKSTDVTADDYSLEEGIVSIENVLSFLRFVEQVILEAQLPALIVYWSRHNVAKLVPETSRYVELRRDSICVSMFSEDKVNPPDEWCFWMETSGLCLILYGIHNGGPNQIISGAVPRSLDDRPPHFSKVPRRPHPHAGNTYISLPEPRRGDQELD